MSLEKHRLALGLVVVAAAFYPSDVFSQRNTPGVSLDGEIAKEFSFDSKQALSNWTVTGDVAIDQTKGRGGQGWRA